MDSEQDRVHPLLRSYLAKLTRISEEERSALTELIRVESHAKGTLLLQEGDIASKCYFLLQGCIRQYTVVDGEEKTTAFFTEEEAVVSFTSYTQHVPCTQNWVCVEDVVAIVGEQDDERAAYAQFPRLQGMTLTMVEQDFGKRQAEFETFIVSSPEERYLNLLQHRPELLQRVPQHQIASYLGVTPESLSRIRRRIHVRKR